MFIRNIMWYHRKSIHGQFSNGYVKHEARSPCFRSQAPSPGPISGGGCCTTPDSGAVSWCPTASPSCNAERLGGGKQWDFSPSNHHYLRCFVVTNSCQRIIHLRCFILVSLLSTRQCPFVGIVSTCRA